MRARRESLMLLLASFFALSAVATLLWSFLMGFRPYPVIFEGGPLDGEVQQVRHRHIFQLPGRYSSVMPLSSVDDLADITEETFDRVLVHHYVGPYFDDDREGAVYLYDREEVR